MRRIGLSAAVLALILGRVATSACSKLQIQDGVATAATTGGPTPSTTAGGSGNRLEEMRRWARCLREQGIDMPDPTKVKGAFDGFDWPQKDDPEAARVEAAQQACRQYDTFSEAAEPFTAAQLQAWLDWAQCMRGHGLEVFDPDPAGRPPLVNLKKYRSQPDLLAAAEKDCLDQLESARDAGQ